IWLINFRGRGVSSVEIWGISPRLAPRTKDCATTVVSLGMSLQPVPSLALSPRSSAILVEELATFKLNAPTCGRYGHIARLCPNGGNPNGAFPSRAPPPGRSLNTSALPPVKCFRCGGLNHMSKACLAPPGTTVSEQAIVSNVQVGSGNPNKGKICYKCQQEGHIARECPQNAEFVA
ncbi:hypothetical protein BD410DRAFT_710730, partial [Rickenella mellea]